MGVSKYSQKINGISPYGSLTEEDDDDDDIIEIISKKEEQLRRCDRALTVLIIGALLICAGLITYLTAIMAETQTGDASAFANSAFTTNLYDVLKKNPGNVFFSPYSLQVALAMAYTGATGNTGKEIQRSLAFSENKDALLKSVQASATALRSSKDVVLNSANGVFVQQDFPVKEAFLKSMKGAFEAEAKTLNFANSADAAGQINSFVGQKTNGKITELFASDAFTDLTRMVLVNAVYFKGSWQKKFDASLTEEGDFHLNNNKTVKVPFMTITADFNSVENDDLKATILELPYHGDLNMVLIVPKEIEGLKYVESKLKNLDLNTLTQTAYSKEVKLTMPKFKLEQKIDLNEPLKELGMKEMFDSGRAEFGGISDKRELYVSQVLQKAFIDVNEEGSEAAAATAIKFIMRKMPMPPEEINVRGPFMFFVRHTKGLVLFAGRVTEL